MSHVASVECEVRDLAALSAACVLLGLEFVEHQKTHRWFGRWLNDWRDPAQAAVMKGHDPTTFGTCEHAIRIPGDSSAYEIGLVFADNSTLTTPVYKFIYDAWGMGGGLLHQKAGPGLVRLQNEYLGVVAERQLQRRGWRTQKVRTEDRIQLVASL